ncbi:MAG: type IV pilus assembly protein PilM [Planctomycetota bacterium]
MPMLKKSSAWGIDVGAHGVKAVKLVAEGEGLRVADFDIVNFADVSGEDDRTLGAIRLLLSRNRIRGKDRVAVSVVDLFSKNIVLPPVDDTRVAKIVDYEARQQIPFPIDDVIWDYQVIGAGKSVGEEMEVALFAVKKEAVQEIVAKVRQAGLPLDIIQGAPVALYNFQRYENQEEAATVVLDVGAKSTHFIIQDGDRFYFRRLPVAGNDITSALQKKFQISFEEAEDLKRNAATSKQVDKLFALMRPVLRDLLGEVQRSIGFYRSRTRQVAIAKVLLLGDSFRMDMLARFFAENLGYPVEVLKQCKEIQPIEGERRAEFDQNFLSFGVALGLAVQAMGEGIITTNLIPKDLARAKAASERRPLFIAAAALLAVLAGTAHYSAVKQEKTLKDLPGNIASVRKTADGQERTLEELTRQEQPILDKIVFLRDLRRDQTLWLPVMGTLMSAIPAGELWVDDVTMELTTPSAWKARMEEKARKGGGVVGGRPTGGMANLGSSAPAPVAGSAVPAAEIRALGVEVAGRIRYRDNEARSVQYIRDTLLRKFKGQSNFKDFDIVANRPIPRAVRKDPVAAEGKSVAKEIRVGDKVILRTIPPDENDYFGFTVMGFVEFPAGG